MSAAISADLISTPLLESEMKLTAKRLLAAGSLQRARHLYVARSFANPSKSLPCSELSLIRRLGWILVCFQILDGIFTNLGVSFFGSDIEGNPILRFLIESCGAILAISLVKILAIAVIISICVFGYRVAWLTRALQGVAGIYFFMAILPWSYILIVHLIDSLPLT